MFKRRSGRALSMFILLLVYDNPAIMENDPGYIARLEALPELISRLCFTGIGIFLKDNFSRCGGNSIHVIEKGNRSELKKFLSLIMGIQTVKCLGGAV